MTQASVNHTLLALTRMTLSRNKTRDKTYRLHNLLLFQRTETVLFHVWMLQESIFKRLVHCVGILRRAKIKAFEKNTASVKEANMKISRFEKP